MFHFKYFTSLQWFGFSSIVSLVLLLSTIFTANPAPTVIVVMNVLLAVFALLFIEWPSKDGFKSVQAQRDRDSKCAAGEHEAVYPNGKPSNFCGNCGFQVNPEAYKQYLVTLTDGNVVEISAINEKHAHSLVVYGENLEVLVTPGKSVAVPRGEMKINPNNIVSIEIKV